MFKDINEFKKYLTGLCDDSKSLKSDINKLLPLAKALNNGLANPFNESDVEGICANIIHHATPVFCDKKGNVITYRLAEFMIKKDPMLVNGFNIYVYTDGVYKPVEERVLYKRIYEHMVLDSNKTTAKAKEVVESIKTITYSSEINNHSKKFINAKNGIVDIEKRKLVKHNPKFKTTIQFNANCLTDKEFQEVFEKSNFNRFLKSTLSEANIITMQECFGLILSPHAKEVQKSFLFLGEGSNGKSTISDIITHLIGGSAFMSNLGLSDFEKTFDTASIEGKTLNMCLDDESVALEKTGKFKAIIAGDTIDIEKKGKDKVSYTPNLTCIIGLNRLPATGDRSHGFYRRQCIIGFNQTFGTKQEVAKGLATQVKDPKIAQKIIADEMDIVFTWALKGLFRVIDNEFMLTENDEVAAELEEYRLESDSVYAFYKFRLEMSPFESDKIQASELYAEYKKYCLELGIPSQNSTNFGRALKGLGLKTKRLGSGNYYLNVFGVKEPGTTE